MPVGDSSAWSQDPFGGAIVGGRLYGRGATDMKGGIAAALWATKVALEQGFRPRGDVVFHVVSDEEVVGNGTREIVETAPAATSRSRWSRPSYGCALQRAVSCISGSRSRASRPMPRPAISSVHAGGNGGGGVNAVEKTVKIIVALQELERQWANAKSHPILPSGFDTLAPAIIVGGPGGGSDGRLNLFSNAGTAPNYCSVEYNMWLYPDESFEKVQAEVEDCRRMRCAAPIRGCASNRRSSPGSSGTSTFRRSTCRSTIRRCAPSPTASARSASNRGPQGFGAATDLAWYGERKLPGIICGPGRLAQCHVADEYLETEHLALAAQVYALMVTEWCG